MKSQYLNGGRNSPIMYTGGGGGWKEKELRRLKIISVYQRSPVLKLTSYLLVMTPSVSFGPSLTCITSLFHSHTSSLQSDSGEMDKFNTKVQIYYNGRTKWFAPTNVKTVCKIDITYFPFDDQHCKLVFGSWTYAGKISSCFKYKNQLIKIFHLAVGCGFGINFPKNRICSAQRHIPKARTNMPYSE